MASLSFGGTKNDVTKLQTGTIAVIKPEAFEAWSDDDMDQLYDHITYDGQPIEFTAWEMSGQLVEVLEEPYDDLYKCRLLHNNAMVTFQRSHLRALSQ